MKWYGRRVSWNVIAHAQKTDFVFRRNGRLHLNRRWRQFSRLLTAEVCTSPIVMLDTPCSEVGLRVLATHSIRQFPLHFPTRASPCVNNIQLECLNLRKCTEICLSAEDICKASLKRPGFLHEIRKPDLPNKKAEAVMLELFLCVRKPTACSSVWLTHWQILWPA